MGDAGAPPLWMAAWLTPRNMILPTHVTTPKYSVILGQTIRVQLWRSARKFRFLLSRSLKVIGTDTDWSATYDFLLVIHSNCNPVSYWLPRQMVIFAKFSRSLAFDAPAEGFPLEFCNGGGLANTGMTPLSDYRRVTFWPFV